MIQSPNRIKGGIKSAPAAQSMPTFLDFFAGSGLVTQGMHGLFKAVWAIDICPKKAEVYRANHGDKYFKLDGIENVRGAELPPTDLAWASFPCQDLSLAGRMDGISGKRSGLVWDWLRIVDEMKRPPPAPGHPAFGKRLCKQLNYFRLSGIKLLRLF